MLRQNERCRPKHKAGADQQATCVLDAALKGDELDSVRVAMHEPYVLRPSFLPAAVQYLFAHVIAERGLEPPPFLELRDDHDERACHCAASRPDAQP